MSTFTFIKQQPAVVPTYLVKHTASGKIIGNVEHAFGGWVAIIPWRDEHEFGYRTRDAAAQRLLLVSGVNPAAWSALPTDPSDGISAVQS